MTLSPVLPIPVLVVVGVALLAVAIAGIVRGDARLAWVFRAVAVVLLAVVALRPALPGRDDGPSVSGGLEVYFAVDTTSSMAAEDVAGPVGETGLPATRLDAAKADITAIAESLPGASFSLVTFDADAVQRVPLTSDVSALETAVDVLTQEVTTYSRGSSVDVAVPELERVLGEARGAAPGNDRVLFYLGDGEQTSDDPVGSFASLAPLVSGGGVLGYGTDSGGRMLVFDGYSDDLGQLGYIQDYSTDPPGDAISRIDTATLTTIADDLGVEYSHRDGTGGVADLVRGIEVGDLQTEPGDVEPSTELYWIPAIGLGLILLAELVRLAGALAEVRTGGRDGGARQRGRGERAR
jgi:Ca-activated chloride channel family protein